MAAKELTVVILNHTNEELQLQPESLQLELGELLDLSKPSPPKNVLAGESVIWSFRSAHIGGGIQGQVAYQMVGFEENASVTFHWSVHLVGTNKFTHTSSVDGFTTRVLGEAADNLLRCLCLNGTSEHFGDGRLL
uniref:Uncharacterized protein n=1 Tax=Bionectria ochroleuca TaxID=29856 RepID=A0A8H7TQK1_BIOOC